MNERKRRFAEAVAAGKSGAEAARAAGYGGKPESLRVQASRLNDDPEVLACLEELRAGRQAEARVAREEAVEVAAKLMRDEGANPYARLQAINTLAKLEGWNAPEKVEHGGKVTVEGLAEKSTGELAQEAAELEKKMKGGKG